ncbi:uncharacterized protein LOC143191806 [Rhynchophorus ferrugineus]|uniref:uncharacterized protein LOC143191806 n=1 Tax=Rhynchophorus ferrugineus TaxID=354439 RepID=UPI003FCE0087
MYDTTQFGCMLKTTSRIEDYFKYLHQELHERTHENSSLKLKLDNVQNLITEKDRKITFLEAEVSILKEKFDNALKETYALQQAHDRLIQDHSTKSIDIKDLKAHLSSMEKDYKETEKKCEKFKNENFQLKEHRTILRNWLNRRIDNGNKNVTLLEKNVHILTTILEEYNKSFTHLNMILIKLSKNIAKYHISVQKNQESLNDIDESIRSYQNNWKKIVDVNKESLCLSENKRNQSFKIKGDPVEDFTKQIKENEVKISQLQNDNVKLEQLLNRFKKLGKK